MNRPNFTPEQAETLAFERYNVAVRALELPSERDQNFLLRPRGCGGRAEEEPGDDEAFILKIGNPEEDEASLAMQNAILARLAAVRPDLDGGRRALFPRVVPDLGGSSLGAAEKDGVLYPLRLVTWLPGVPVARVRPQRPELLRSWGRVLALLDATLADFEHPAAERGFHWDLRSASSIFEERVGSVKGKDRRALLRRRMADCEERLTPLIAGLRTQVVHGDANDYNVLANRVGGIPPNGRYGDRRVVGIIDFGDAMRTWLASEPAVAGAYAMLSKRDPVGALAQLVSGFHEEFPLGKRRSQPSFRSRACGSA